MLKTSGINSKQKVIKMLENKKVIIDPKGSNWEKYTNAYL